MLLRTCSVLLTALWCCVWVSSHFLCVLGGLPLLELLFSCDVQLGVHVLAKYIFGKKYVCYPFRPDFLFCFFLLLAREREK